VIRETAQVNSQLIRGIAPEAVWRVGFLVRRPQVSLRLEGSEAFSKFFDDQVRIWGAVVRDNGIKAES